MQDGMDSLGEDDRNNFVSDLKGFVSYVRDKGFQAYAERVRSSFRDHHTLLLLLLMSLQDPLASSTGTLLYDTFTFLKDTVFTH